MKVFLSHAPADRVAARRMKESLETAGISVWSSASILPGDDAFKRVSEELEQADAMVVLVTREATRSEWVQRELEYALSAEKYSRKVFPVFLGWSEKEGEPDYPWILKRFKTFTLPTTGPSQAFDELAAALKQSA